METPSSDDAPLYVPEEFEVEHLEAARRSVASSRGGRRPVPRAAPPAAGGGEAPERRWRVLAVSLHAVAAVLSIAIAALSGTWLVGALGVVTIGLSLIVVLHAIKRYGPSRRRDAGGGGHPGGPGSHG
jgi:hypothetical protein